MISCVETSNDTNRLAPKYHRVTPDMFACTADGIWSPAMAISLELDLCEEFGVSRITVRPSVISSTTVSCRSCKVREHLSPSRNFRSDSFSEHLASMRM